MNYAMNREIEESMRRQAAAWYRLNEAVAHGENEVEREQLLRRAEAIAQPWRESAYADEWLYLQNLAADWQRAPEVMRTFTARAQAAEIGELTDVEVRSLTQMQRLADPREAGAEGWQRTHDRICQLQGQLAAGTATTAVRASIRFQLSMLDDRTTWPPDWFELEMRAERDPAHAARQLAIYEQAVRDATAAHEDTHEVMVPELAETA